MSFSKTVTLALLAGLVLWVAACSKSPKQAALPAGAVVLAIGDSVTYGTGAAPGEDYPAHLARIAGWTLHNHGIPGVPRPGYGRG